MSWFGKDSEAAEASVRRDTDPASPSSSRAPRRGPVIRTSDFAAPVRRVRPIAEDRVADDIPAYTSERQPALDRDITPVPTRLAVEEPAPAAVVVEPVPDAQAPLLDIGSVMRSIWKHRRVVGLLLVLGVVGGAALVPMISKKYTSETSLYFDPRQVQSVDADQPQPSVSSEAILAVIDSQSKILTSGKVMAKVATDLELYKDKEFGGKATATAEDAKNTNLMVALLQRATKIAREPSTYVVTLQVTTRDPAKSAAIANDIVQSFLEEENAVMSGFYKSTNTTLDVRLEQLGTQLREAEEAVESYKAENDMVTADGGLISDKRLVSLNELLVSAQNKTIEAKARVDTTSKLKLEDMVSGSLPDDVSSATLVDLYRQYATIAANVGSLESQLGSRHPRLAAAKASLQGLTSEIQRELQRLVAIAQTDLTRAQKAEDDVAKELSVQKASQTGTSLRLIELHELERRAAATRQIYEAVLKRTRQTSEDQNLLSSNVRVISQAEPALKADGPGSAALMIAGVFGGLILGLGLGIFYAIIRLVAGHPYIRGMFKDPAAARKA